MAPIASSFFPSFLNEAFLTEDGLPRSLLLPSRFRPVEETSPPKPTQSPRFQKDTENTKIAKSLVLNNRDAPVELQEIESRTSSVVDFKQTQDRGDRPKRYKLLNIINHVLDNMLFIKNKINYILLKLYKICLNASG